MSMDEHGTTRTGEWLEGDGDGPELLARVKERSVAFDRRIRRRDLREVGAAIFVVVAFGYETITAGSWLSRMGAAVVMTGALYVMWKLRRARPGDAPEEAGRPVADCLRLHLRRVERQLELHETVLWWYLAPVAAGSMLFVAGLGGAPWATAITLAAIGLISAWVLRANRRFVRRELRPRRERIAGLLRELEGTAGEG